MGSDRARTLLYYFFMVQYFLFALNLHSRRSHYIKVFFTVCSLRGTPPLCWNCNTYKTYLLLPNLFADYNKNAPKGRAWCALDCMCRSYLWLVSNTTNFYLVRKTMLISFPTLFLFRMHNITLLLRVRWVILLVSTSSLNRSLLVTDISHNQRNWAVVPIRT